MKLNEFLEVGIVVVSRGIFFCSRGGFLMAEFFPPLEENGVQVIDESLGNCDFLAAKMLLHE